MVLAHGIEQNWNYFLELSYSTFRRTSTVMKFILHCCVITFQFIVWIKKLSGKRRFSGNLVKFSVRFTEKQDQTQDFLIWDSEWEQTIKNVQIVQRTWFPPWRFPDSCAVNHSWGVMICTNLSTNVLSSLHTLPSGLLTSPIMDKDRFTCASWCLLTVSLNKPALTEAQPLS